MVAGVGALAAVAAAPVIVERLGFTQAGIAASSAAARMMRLYRSPVPKHSTIAVLQSIGAAGMGAAKVKDLNKQQRFMPEA